MRSKSAEETPEKSRKSQNPHPFGEVLLPAAQPSWAADDIAKSSALLGRAPRLPSPAGPWGRPDGIFQTGSFDPKWCQWGPFRIRTARCSSQNRPRRPRKNLGNHKILTPFGIPLPPIHCSWDGTGPRPFRRRPRPMAAIYSICANGSRTVPPQKCHFPGENLGRDRAFSS